VSAVHHDCLKTWLVESYSNPDDIRCKVCDQKYNIQRGSVWLPSGLTTVHWFQTAAIISVMCSAAASVCMMVRLFEHVAVRTISVGSAILVEYVCLRFLGFNMLSAYNRAKLSAIKISGRRLVASPVHASLSHPVIVRTRSSNSSKELRINEEDGQALMVTIIPESRSRVGGNLTESTSDETMFGECSTSGTRSCRTSSNVSEETVIVHSGDGGDCMEVDLSRTEAATKKETGAGLRVTMSGSLSA
jgi:hypothetical protein